MITIVACFIGAMALFALAVAVWCVVMVRREELAELEGEHISLALSRWRMEPAEEKSKLPVCDICGGSSETVARCWALGGLETFACERCRFV
jgi:hypothetical protein